MTEVKKVTMLTWYVHNDALNGIDVVKAIKENWIRLPIVNVPKARDK